MTRDEMLAMKAGRELDALVAEKVMGWRSTKGWEDCWATGAGPYYWPGDGRMPVGHAAFSTDIAPAWKVMEKMVENGYCPAILSDDNGHWALSLDGWQNVPDGDEPQDITTTFLVEAALWADTVPLAICRAALLAVMEVDE